jgi:hypothetical protein
MKSIIFGFLRRLLPGPGAIRRAGLSLQPLFPEERIEGRRDAFSETGHVGVDDEQQDERREDDQDGVGAPTHRSTLFFFPGRRKRISLYAGRTADRSALAFGLFLEYRDLGLFLLFPEVKTEEKHRTQRQRGQQKLEEAFHRNLSLLFYLNPGKSQLSKLPPEHRFA